MEFTKQEKKVFSKMGKKGGKIGGAQTKKKYGVEFYSAIGKKGGRPRKDLTTKSKSDKVKA
jgi:general stress protein YciG